MVEKNEKLARNILIGLITACVVGMVAIVAISLPSKEVVPAPAAYTDANVDIGPYDTASHIPPLRRDLSVEDRLDIYGLYSSDFETAEDYETYMDKAFGGPVKEPRRGIDALARLSHRSFNADEPFAIYNADGAQRMEDFPNYWEYMEKYFPELLYTAKNIYADAHEVTNEPTNDAPTKPVVSSGTSVKG